MYNFDGLNHQLMIYGFVCIIGLFLPIAVFVEMKRKNGKMSKIIKTGYLAVMVLLIGIEIFIALYVGKLYSTIKNPNVMVYEGTYVDATYVPKSKDIIENYIFDDGTNEKWMTITNVEDLFPKGLEIGKEYKIYYVEVLKEQQIVVKIEMK